MQASDSNLLEWAITNPTKHYKRETMTFIFRIPVEQLDDDNDLSTLQAKYSRDFYIGKPLPEGVEVISVEELLRELNEHDPDFYFKTLLSRNNAIK